MSLFVLSPPVLVMSGERLQRVGTLPIFSVNLLQMQNFCRCTWLVGAVMFVLVPVDVSVSVPVFFLVSKSSSLPIAINVTHHCRRLNYNAATSFGRADRKLHGGIFTY